jgi:excisionase family DNA binding protein
MSAEERDLITVSEAAAILGISNRAVSKRLENGHMRGERVHPRLWLIPREEVDRWREIGRMKPGPKGQPAEGGQ